MLAGEKWAMDLHPATSNTIHRNSRKERERLTLKLF
jgi:hypothetical protein